MIIKCKMCGGDMKLSADQRTGTCEYCGSTMTLPKVDDEQRAAAFNRGNHFRRIGEFDKALSVYESIVREDETDAEAHWCCALCRFGIEYVKDPASGEYIPTCHRASFDSFLEDVDYKAALEHADAVARAQYQKDAETIAQVQRGILLISQKEKPFDVFICYKESDENGNRTVDSTLAQDIYYQLTEQGRRVFFARITLEDKAGQEYEPYIFAALHSAKVMLVVGTKPEYLNAVWVKNEWSRYLALMKHDRKRLLIPCYRDMDPYDLPEQLSVLQSYDMSKIGFIQDLIRGIAKILDADRKPEEKIVERVIEHGAGGAAPGIDSLMKRAYLFMEDGDFDSADEYLNRVLDIDPDYAPAYAARTCTALKFRRESQLGEATFLYDSNPDWKKALRFADEKQKAIYEGYERETKERVKRQIRDFRYDCAMMTAAGYGDCEDFSSEIEAYKRSCSQTEQEKRATGLRRELYEECEQAFDQAVKNNFPGLVSEAVYKEAAEMFRKIGDEEAEKRSGQCLVLAKEARQLKIYLDAEAVYDKGITDRDVKRIVQAAEAYEMIPDYEDSLNLARDCREKAASIQAEEYQAATEAMKTAGKESGAWKRAQELLESANLDDYRDVEMLRKKALEMYRTCLTEEEQARKRKEEQEAKIRKQRVKKMIAAAVVVAAAAFVVNKQVIQPSVRYSEAMRQMEQGQYSEAYVAFKQLKGYKDVDALLSENKMKFYDAYYAVGNEILFGSYEQDGDTGNGKEEIEWIILDREGDNALLLSKYSLDAKPYNEDEKEITWEQSTIRQWLNSTFVDAAFSSEEQAAVLETEVDNSREEGYYSAYAEKDENNTKDRVFLLSCKEAFEDYFNDNKERICEPTPYVMQKVSGEGSDPETDFWWWLRSINKRGPAGSVNNGGGLSALDISSDFGCVRPALWINLDSDAL